MDINLVDLERFASKVGNPDDNGCACFLGMHHPSGFGLFTLKDGSTVTAHRLAWYLAYGSFPEGRVKHICGRKDCLNPRHLLLPNQTKKASEDTQEAIRLRYLRLLESLSDEYEMSLAEVLMTLYGTRST